MMNGSVGSVRTVHHIVSTKRDANQANNRKRTGKEEWRFQSFFVSISLFLCGMQHQQGQGGWRDEINTNIVSCVGGKIDDRECAISSGTFLKDVAEDETFAPLRCRGRYYYIDTGAVSEAQQERFGEFHIYKKSYYFYNQILFLILFTFIAYGTV